MQIKRIEKINDVVQLQPEFFTDHRGQYVNWYQKKYFEGAFGSFQRQWDFVEGLPEIDWKEDNFSVSTKNVFRGLHGDFKTWKLLQCISGILQFVIIDNREESSTYRNTYSCILSEENRTQMLIPPGVGNGHLCLTEKCIFGYKNSEYYRGQEAQFVVSYKEIKDVEFMFDGEPILSERDMK